MARTMIWPRQYTKKRLVERKGRLELKAPPAKLQLLPESSKAKLHPHRESGSTRGDLRRPVTAILRVATGAKACRALASMRFTAHAGQVFDEITHRRALLSATFMEMYNLRVTKECNLVVHPATIVVPFKFQS
ncbi:hypothetical protein HPP92_006018 [Vanilla planifolia]|uniref:Uncharacterized protein n=1 Tax=Vanilla planifolia TaxID=51239 RepID=A0A835VBX3_VANPL|nr:hypothetical protein HPP92_006018 [Vanilla planifolia]